MTTDTVIASTFDSAEALKHCKTAGDIFAQLEMEADETEQLLSVFESRLSSALARIRRELSEQALTNLIAFCRTVDIARMRGLCEVAIYRKYHSYAESHLHEARNIAGFVRAGVEVVESEMFLR